MSLGSTLGMASLTSLNVSLPTSSTKAFSSLIDVAIHGQGPFPGAKSWAGKILAQKQGDVEGAIDKIVTSSVTLGGAQGFVTNLGGLMTAIVTMPANIVGVTLVQSRMVSAIAHLRGYDVEDPRVRSAIMMVLLGRADVQEQIRKGNLPSTPLVIATAPVSDSDLENQIATRVLGIYMSETGGKHTVAFVGRKIPLFGGGVGLVTDGYSTHAVSRYAKSEFVSRRGQLRP